MSNKIKTQGNQLFSIPNDELGQLFLKLANKYLNGKAYRTQRRGRAKNRKQIEKRTRIFTTHGVQQKYADWIAYYVYDKSEYWHKAYMKLVKEARDLTVGDMLAVQIAGVWLNARFIEEDRPTNTIKVDVLNSDGTVYMQYNIRRDLVRKLVRV